MALPKSWSMGSSLLAGAHVLVSDNKIQLMASYQWKDERTHI